MPSSESAALNGSQHPGMRRGLDESQVQLEDQGLVSDTAKPHQSITVRATSGQHQAYPEPLIFEPLNIEQHNTGGGGDDGSSHNARRTHHTSTFIILHGRGGNAHEFGPALLDAELPSAGKTFRQTLPSTRFVIPTASLRRAKKFRRMVIRQWFDIYSLADTSSQAETQIEGLRESSQYVHDLLRQEIEYIGGDASRVFLGGLSQGCATVLISLLLWDGPPLGGVFGIAGWLPFEHLLTATLDNIGFGDQTQGVVFEHDDVDLQSADEAVAVDGEPPEAYDSAVTALREMLDMHQPRCPPQHDEGGRTQRARCSAPPVAHRTRIMLCHGTEDEKVPISLGRQATDCLRAMGLDVIWKHYPGLAHWFSVEQLTDILEAMHGTD